MFNKFNPFVKNTKAAVKKSLHMIEDTLLPPTCLGCRKLTAFENGFCAECWPRLSFLTKPYCAVLGTPFSYDIGKNILSPAAIADPPPFYKARAALIYDEEARILVSLLKYNDRIDLAQAMALWMNSASDGMVSECNLIVPVPLHRKRLFFRQYNQAAELARQLSQMSKLDMNVTALERIKPTKQQVGLNALQRRKNMNNAFKVKPSYADQIMGKSIILVDDVYTTGATAKMAVKALLAAGAEKVGVLTFARVVTKVN